jgi:hypothetical protein
MMMRGQWRNDCTTGAFASDAMLTRDDRILAAKQRDAEADTSAVEQEIDELVYALYGLTPEEIKIVKEAASK